MKGEKVRGIPGGNIFAVGDCILQYHEGQWSDVTTYNDFAVGGYPYDWGDPDYLPAQKLAGSFIAHYDGDKWSRIEVEEDGVLYDIWGSDGELFAVGGEISGDEDFAWDFIGGQIFHSIDGINWQINVIKYDTLLYK